MKKVILIVFFGISSILMFGQTKFSSNGIKFSLPKGFNRTRSRGSEFATFNRGDTLQIAFANGCDNYVGRSDSKLSKDMTADICFETLFVKIKAGEKLTWVSNPKRHDNSKVSLQVG
ncbi:hypothetical protein [Chryseolinea soli]|uniref:Uncharacterized protein n=1 Tax=Chryseolinea soli TaxID=2321403 RepID=A0A385SSN9_9BACT|nr:hypothetical protein [Chryseolinea soli]AYB33341.1 hypothetical protein D4L85_23350 [Chryseolinea soli]